MRSPSSGTTIAVLLSAKYKTSSRVCADFNVIRAPLARVTACDEGLLKLLQKKLDVLFRGQRTHHADAENFACERSKAAGNFNAWSIQKVLAHFGFVKPCGNAHGVQGCDPMRFGNVHAQTHTFNAFDKSPVATAMPLPSILNSFLGDDHQGFAQGVEHGNRRRVMIAMRYGGVVVNQFEV